MGFKKHFWKNVSDKRCPPPSWQMPSKISMFFYTFLSNTNYNNYVLKWSKAHKDKVRRAKVEQRTGCLIIYWPKQRRWEEFANSEKILSGHLRNLLSTLFPLSCLSSPHKLHCKRNPSGWKLDKVCLQTKSFVSSQHIQFTRFKRSGWLMLCIR